MTEKQFRNKTTFVTFLFSLLVVFIHSYNIDLYLGAGPYGTAQVVAAAFLSILSATCWARWRCRVFL